MKFLESYKKACNCNSEDDVFNYLINNTKDTIRSWNFFVDWAKISSNIENIEPTLNLWNVLIGKDNIKNEFIKLAAKYTEIINVIPVLIATRDNCIKVLDPLESNIFNYREYSFSLKKHYSENDLSEIADFAEKCGLFSLIKEKKIKSIVDYVTGIEVGIDTNARKNRSGITMESLTEMFIKKICNKHGYNYISQAKASKIKQFFNMEVAVDKSSRSYDFAIHTNSKLYLVETNYYGGGGSKLKSVAGEFTSLYRLIRRDTPKHGFIWVTDGKGWTTAKRPLREAFNATDFILNLDMLEKGILENILVQGL